MSETSDMIRKMFKEGDDVRDAGLKTPDEIIRFDDILYGTDSNWQVLDVYKPKAQEKANLPVIVSIHGGGWVYGDKERYQYYCMDLSTRGFAVVNFTYRLAPEFQYPASFEDTNMVFTWIFEHAKEYGLDTEHIFAVGDSAGAHMLGLYSCICTNKSFAKEFDFKVPNHFVPKAIALNNGTYTIQIKKEEDDQTTKFMADFLPGKGTKEELAQIDVVRHVTKNFPPAYIMTASDDFLIQAHFPLQAKLIEENASFEFHFYGKKKENLGHVFHLNMRLKEAKKCNDDECAFFRKFL